MSTAEIGTVFSDREESLASLSLYALYEHDLQSIVDRVVESTCRMMEMDHCMVMKLDSEKRLILIGGTPEVVRENRGKTFPLDEESDVSFALREEQPVMVQHYDRENRFGVIPLLGGLEISSGLHVLMGGTDRIYGVLSLYSEKNHDISRHDIHYTQILANIIGMSIEREYSTRKLQDTNRQLKEEMERSQQYQREILRNDLMERWKIGEFLHDNLAQTLVSVRMMVDGLGTKLRDREIDLSSDIEYIDDIIDRGIESVRNLTQEVVPVDVDEDGVAVAFEHLVRQAEKVHRVTCTFERDEVVNRIHSREVATNLYRVVQEAVKNAAIHGQADEIHVSVLGENGQNLRLSVRDNGKGFTKSDLKQKKGMGLNIMTHRMELLGGTIDIRSNPGAGRYTTEVTCTLPLESA